MTIRPAIESDLPGILEIYNYAVLNSNATADYEPHTFEQRAAWLADRKERGLPVLVATDGDDSDRIVGWASLNPYHSRVGYKFSVENAVYVASDQQRKGIGKALLAETIRIAQQLKMHAIIAAIDGTNDPSIRLHEQFGFQLSGRLPEVMKKFDRWLDVVYMVKLLD